MTARCIRCYPLCEGVVSIPWCSRCGRFHLYGACPPPSTANPPAPAEREETL